MLVAMTVDFTAALTILTSIIKDFGPGHRANAGDDTEDGCTYFAKNKENLYSNSLDIYNLKPVCIVGQAFHRLGIMRALLTTNDDQYGACIPGSLIWDNASQMGVEFTDDARTLFRMVQQAQDSGMPWGLALKEGVGDTREALLKKFQAEHPAFHAHVDEDVKALTPVVEPLAEWERELLGDRHADLVKAAVNSEVVMNSLRSREKIYAIKELRAISTCSLLEAKRAIEDPAVVKAVADSLF